MSTEDAELCAMFEELLVSGLATAGDLASLGFTDDELRRAGVTTIPTTATVSSSSPSPSSSRAATAAAAAGTVPASSSYAATGRLSFPMPASAANRSATLAIDRLLAWSGGGGGHGQMMLRKRGWKGIDREGSNDEANEEEEEEGEGGNSPLWSTATGPRTSPTSTTGSPLAPPEEPTTEPKRLVVVAATGKADYSPPPPMPSRSPSSPSCSAAVTEEGRRARLSDAARAQKAQVASAVCRPLHFPLHDSSGSGGGHHHYGDGNEEEEEGEGEGGHHRHDGMAAFAAVGKPLAPVNSALRFSGVDALVAREISRQLCRGGGGGHGDGDDDATAERYHRFGGDGTVSPPGDEYACM